MEYVFGTKGDRKILKVKGREHTDLTGYHEVERVFPDQTITDNFRIVRKLESAEDSEGNCYDWYEIDQHFKVADKTGPIVEKAAETTSAMENALCEQDAAIDERLTAIEDAVCELDAAINS